ncbi:MAG: tRNA (N6-threonylcarbamoyladenosine(37)-N6)-methyltransferase TrmO [Lachnospiraceae bacterium]|nr:tRNA (N6-threonylcarbamoyladenosine(37)-N6)-methyltransferase TrmO [Lachnospiraceae bacterium]
MKSETYEIHPIAYMENDFPEKFGIPRQSGLVEELTGRIVFESVYRNPDALRGLEGYDYIWLIWGFDEAKRYGGEKKKISGESETHKEISAGFSNREQVTVEDENGAAIREKEAAVIKKEERQVREEKVGRIEKFHPTVRPPRLGGNTRMGVFATRSPFRPNSLGLSSVRLLNIDYDTPDGPALLVGGADLKNGTPIFDIKPYLPHVDSHPNAAAGFAGKTAAYHLKVAISEENLNLMPEEKRAALMGILENDPRPSYQNDPERVYGLNFAGYEVKFRVEGEKLTVIKVE